MRDSLHNRQNETREIFNKDLFTKMKSNAIYINAAGGGIHNEQNLIDALNAGSIRVHDLT
ncbi:MAG: NAD(P)-dependent oxidoreductase [Chitinophagaceae bacterium]